MESNYKPKILRSISEYMSKSFKFYDLKGDYVAPAVFILILAVNFICYYLFGNFTYDIDFAKPEGLESLRLASSRIILVFFATNIIINLISAIYLYAYIRELKGENYSLKECFINTGKNSIRIILLYVFVFIYVPVYALILRLPGLIAYIVSGIFLFAAVYFVVLYFTFIFGNPCIQDKNKSLYNALKGSRNLTRGHKIEIFSIILIFKFISLLFMFFSTPFLPSGNSELVRIFVESFINSIFSIIEVRLIGLMYFDLEY